MRLSLRNLNVSVASKWLSWDVTLDFSASKVHYPHWLIEISLILDTVSSTCKSNSLKARFIKEKSLNSKIRNIIQF